MKSELLPPFTEVKESFQQKRTLLKTIGFGIYNVAAFLWVIVLLSVYFLIANQRERVLAVQRFFKANSAAFQLVQRPVERI